MPARRSGRGRRARGHRGVAAVHSRRGRGASTQSGGSMSVARRAASQGAGVPSRAARGLRWRPARPSAPTTRRGSPTSWDGPEPPASANSGWSRTLHQPRAHHTHAPRRPHRVVRRRVADARGPGGCRARAGRGRSGRTARRWSTRARNGHRAPDLVRAHPLDVEVDQRRGRARRGRSRSAAVLGRRGCRSGRSGRRGPWPGRASAAVGSGWRRGGPTPRRGGPGPPIPGRRPKWSTGARRRTRPPSCQSPPRPHCSLPATVTSPGTRAWTSMRPTKGSAASRSSTLTNCAASSRWARPAAPRMCSITS